VDDPFEILEVRPGATSREITAAYRRLVKLYHPDLQGPNDTLRRKEAERRMLEITQARRLLRNRTVSPGNRGMQKTLVTSHYLIFDPLGHRSSVLFVVKDEDGHTLGEVKSSRATRRDGPEAWGLGARYQIGPVGGSLIEVSRLLGRVAPMVKIEDLRNDKLVGHIARRDQELWMESLGTDQEPAKLRRLRDHYVVELGDQEVGRVERSQSSVGESFAVTVSPEGSDELRMFLLAAPIAVLELT
jgi:DnaJ domain